MGGKLDRRAAKAAWRERKADWAVTSMRIGDSVWVKLTPDPVALENRLRFMLKQGGAGLAPGMVAACKAHGEVNFEVLERLDADLSDLARERVGEARLAHWQAALGARRW
ncbi:hypothetical protein [Sinisalibacter aestuarii]|uniref:Uncharacterized protein n=1 Tax=Sinisalibacter aestuarii TaxID=2949426 RepID=A0ABQ5LWC4_9RHOB|nr:hypothetical protein [Sinisalibacter aestuarii]GKY89068.1 hypothetical protein STA1M1_29370 [Sinisalibacter aestuarii]